MAHAPMRLYVQHAAACFAAAAPPPTARAHRTPNFAAVAHQVNTVYRTGEMDYCRESTAAFIKCMKIRISKREDAEVRRPGAPRRTRARSVRRSRCPAARRAAQVLIEELERAKLPPGNHIFKFRELPRKGFSFKNTTLVDESADEEACPSEPRWPPPEWDTEVRDDMAVAKEDEEYVFGSPEEARRAQGGAAES